MKNEKTILNKAYKEWLLGSSLKTLSIKYKIPKSTLSYKFRKIFGEGYSLEPRLKGVLNILEEYLKSDILSTDEKRVLKSYIKENYTKLFKADYCNRNNPIYTNKEEQTKTCLETSKSKNDFRSICEKYFIKGISI